MPATAQDYAIAIACISSLKMTQKSILAQLRRQADAARKAGDTERAQAMVCMTRRISQQNPVIYRAKQKALNAQDIQAVASALHHIAERSDQIRKDINVTSYISDKAEQFVVLIDRTACIFS